MASSCDSPRALAGDCAGVSPDLTAALGSFSCFTATHSTHCHRLVPAPCLPPTRWEPHFPFPPREFGDPARSACAACHLQASAGASRAPSASWCITQGVVASSPALEPRFLRRAGHPGPYVVVGTPLQGHSFLVLEVGRQEHLSHRLPQGPNGSQHLACGQRPAQSKRCEKLAGPLRPFHGGLGRGVGGRRREIQSTPFGL